MAPGIFLLFKFVYHIRLTGVNFRLLVEKTGSPEIKPKYVQCISNKTAIEKLVRINLENLIMTQLNIFLQL